MRGTPYVSYNGPRLPNWDWSEFHPLHRSTPHTISILCYLGAYAYVRADHSRTTEASPAIYKLHMYSHLLIKELR